MGLYVVVVTFSLWQIASLGFEHERRRFFPGNDTDLAFTEHFFEQIEVDDIYIFAGIELDESVLSPESYKRINALTDECEQLDVCEAVMSLSKVKKLKKTGPRLYGVPIVNSKSNSRESDSLTIVQHPYILNNLVSTDFKSFNVILKTGVKTQAQADSAYYGFKRTIEKLGFTKYHLSGYPVVQSLSVNALKWEMQLYTTLATLILIVSLLLVYRSIPGLFIPLMSLVGGLVIFFAYIKLSGQSLDLMSSLFPILMLIFLMADVVHLQTHYIDKLEEGHQPIKALEISLKEIGLALFLTSFTTAIGFGTLVTSRIEAVRNFGFNSAVGVMIAFVTVMIFASSGLLFFKKGKIKNRKGSGAFWTKLMDKVYFLNKRKSRNIILITVALTLLAVMGISLISTNTFMKDEFPDGHKMKEDFVFFEQNFGGVRSFEMAIIPKEERLVDDADVLQEIGKLENYLQDEQDMYNLLSPTSPYRLIHDAYSKGKSGYAVPESSRKIRQYKTILSADTLNQVKSVLSEDRKLGRMSARLEDKGSNFHALRNAEIRTWIDGNLDTNVVNFRVVGTTLMYDKNHEYLRKSLLKTIGLAFLIVGILFSILFRDFRMVVVSMIPNILPLALAAAAMGFLGITLYSLTSLFFAISFGIAVDDTIHILTRYKLERRKGKTVDKALRTTMHISGKAIVLTSVILVASFMVLIFSSFKGTYYIGVLVSITLIAAVLADLFLLPQLLYFVNKREAKRKGKKLL